MTRGDDRDWLRDEALRRTGQAGPGRPGYPDAGPASNQMTLVLGRTLTPGRDHSVNRASTPRTAGTQARVQIGAATALRIPTASPGCGRTWTRTASPGGGTPTASPGRGLTWTRTASPGCGTPTASLGGGRTWIRTVSPGCGTP